jgi:hypothetical protein
MKATSSFGLLVPTYQLRSVIYHKTLILINNAAKTLFTKSLLTFISRARGTVMAQALTNWMQNVGIPRYRRPNAVQ